MFTIPTQKIVYQGESATNNKLLTSTNITSNWQYRQYIQNNAIQIMKYNTMSAINASGNNPYVINQTNADKNVFLYQSTHDNRTAKVHHPNTDMRENYLKTEQFNSRKIAPVIPTTWFGVFYN